MQSAELIDLIHSLRALPAENGFCEFKVNWNQPDHLGLLISALSNGACLEGERFAYLVWGVKDATHELVGTTFDHRGKVTGTNQELELWLSQMLQPGIHFKFYETVIDGFRIVLLRIPAAASITTKFKHIAYIRVGSATPKLSDYPEREAALTAALRPFVWEQGIALSGLTENDVLSAIDVESYFALVRQKQPASPVDVINKLRIERIIHRETNNRFEVTNVGAVLFARKLASFDGVARKLVRVIQYEGKSRTVTLKEQPGGRGYASGFQGLVKYIMGVLPQSEKIEGALRHVRESYDEEMIRESVANALIHQDFAITGTGPMIEIFKDRIEISNPGRPLIDPDRFIDMPPRSRNELLASMMRRAFICEERGSGVDKVVMAAERLILPAPEFRIDGDNNRTIIHGPRPFRDTTPAERVRACYQHAVINFLRNDRMTNASLRMRLGIDDRNAAQVSRVINQAVEERHIKQSDSWSTRSGTYVPIWA